MEVHSKFRGKWGQLLEKTWGVRKELVSERRRRRDVGGPVCKRRSLDDEEKKILHVSERKFPQGRRDPNEGNES